MSGARSLSGPIVHVSADFPDSWNAAKPEVVRSLIELVEDRFDQQVVSLNRVSGWSPAPRIQWRGEPGFESAAYAAPGLGLLHRTMLLRLGDALADRLAQREKPALLVGHKLTIEGLAVARVAQLLGVPYALSVQGNTDTKVLAVRPDLRTAFARVWHGAAVVFSFAPWAQQAVEARLGKRSGPVVPLPCPTPLDVPQAPTIGGDGIVTAFHLRKWREKNLPRLARAAALAGRDEPRLRIALVGGGTPSETHTAQIAAARSNGRIALEGPLAHADMPPRFNRAIGMAMPSLRESFGLVFIEALFAGCPVLYPAGRAIDGWLDDQPFARAVDPHDAHAIADGLLWLHRDEAPSKSALAKWQRSSDARRFRRQAIARTFGDSLAEAARPARSAP